MRKSWVLLNSSRSVLYTPVRLHWFNLMIAPKKEAPPKKEAAPKAEKPKKEEKPAPEEEEDDVPKEKAAKHPIAALGPSALPIDEWKRQYSNNDTDVALKWFWEHYDPKDFSLWRVDYKVHLQE